MSAPCSRRPRHKPFCCGEIMRLSIFQTLRGAAKQPARCLYRVGSKVMDRKFPGSVGSLFLCSKIVVPVPHESGLRFKRRQPLRITAMSFA